MPIKTKCIRCQKEFDDVNYEERFGRLCIRQWCNGCVKELWDTSEKEVKRK